METSEEKFWRLTNPIVWGVLITSTFLLLLIIFSFSPFCEVNPKGTQLCSTKFRKFLNSSPNEIGDTFAGIAGALAFLWIIITVLLQSQELRAQRIELSLQRKEYHNMVLAQEKQIVLLEKQGGIFKKEQSARAEEQVKEIVNCLLDGIYFNCSRLDYFQRNGYRFDPAASTTTNALNLVHIIDQAPLPTTVDISEFAKTFPSVNNVYDLIKKYRTDLSKAQNIRLSHLQVDRAIEFLESIASQEVLDS